MAAVFFKDTRMSYFDFDFCGLERDLERVFEDYMDDLKERLKKYVSESMLPTTIGAHGVAAASNEEWVSRACANVYGRPALKYMRVRDGVAEATNGHILLMAKTDLPDGFFLPNEGVIAKSDDKVIYPNTDIVIPKYENYEPLIATKKGERMQVNGGSLVDSQYLLLITEGDEKEWEIAFDEESTMKALMFRQKGGERWAVLMPLMR